jgi:hypothetical protein
MGDWYVMPKPTSARKEETKMDDGIIVAEFEKNASEVVRVRLTEYQGKALLDIRAFYEDRETHERKPGKGLAIRRELLPELKAALEEAERMMNAS